MLREKAPLSGVRDVHAVGGHASERQRAREREEKKMEEAMGLPPLPGSALDQAGVPFMSGFRPGIIGEKKGGRPLPQLRIPDVGSPDDPEIYTPREPEIASPREPEIASPRDPEPKSDPERREPARR